MKKLQKSQLWVGRLLGRGLWVAVHVLTIIFTDESFSFQLKMISGANNVLLELKSVIISVIVKHFYYGPNI